MDAEQVRQFVVRHGFFTHADELAITFLTGGVSSTVARVEGGGRCLVVKCALPRLKVAGEWRSGVERSAVEARCGQVLGELVPGCVPAVLVVDGSCHAFAMSCAPGGSQTWKSLLMEGVTHPRTATVAGELLANIHRQSAGRQDLRSSFGDQTFFEELRIDPYLRTIARSFADLEGSLGKIIGDLLATRLCLVHGDYSPKNLLVISDDRLLLLDHEVAHWGNPAFDTAFAINHLCLKALKFSSRAQRYLDCALAFWEAYRRLVSVELLSAQRITGRLIGALMVARVEGKSPVEYIETKIEKERVRSVGAALIRDRASDVVDAIGHVAREIASGQD